MVDLQGVIEWGDKLFRQVLSSSHERKQVCRAAHTVDIILEKDAHGQERSDIIALFFLGLTLASYGWLHWLFVLGMFLSCLACCALLTTAGVVLSYPVIFFPLCIVYILLVMIPLILCIICQRVPTNFLDINADYLLVISGLMLPAFIFLLVLGSILFSSMTNDATISSWLPAILITSIVLSCVGCVSMIAWLWNYFYPNCCLPKLGKRSGLALEHTWDIVESKHRVRTLRILDSAFVVIDIIANSVDSYLALVITLFVALQFEQFQETAPLLIPLILCVAVSGYPRQFMMGSLSLNSLEESLFAKLPTMEHFKDGKGKGLTESLRAMRHMFCPVEANAAHPIVRAYLKCVTHDPPIFQRVSPGRLVTAADMISDVLSHTYRTKIDERVFWPSLWSSLMLEIAQALLASLALGCEAGWSLPGYCKSGTQSPLTVLIFVMCLVEPFLRIAVGCWITALRLLRDGDQVFMHARAFEKKFANHFWFPVETMLRPGPEIHQVWNIWPSDCPVEIHAPQLDHCLMECQSCQVDQNITLYCTIGNLRIELPILSGSRRECEKRVEIPLKKAGLIPYGASVTIPQQVLATLRDQLEVSCSKSLEDETRYELSERHI